MYQGLLFPTSGFSCLVKQEASSSDKEWDRYQELQTLSAISFEICLSSLQSESWDESVTDANMIHPALLKFSKQDLAWS